MSNFKILYPIESKERRIWEIYNEMKSLQWREDLVINDCKKDLKDLDEIRNTDYWELLKFPIYYFCIIEKMIMDNINTRYLNYFNSPVFQSAFAIQSYMESIHQITYNEFMKIYIGDFKEIFNNENIQAKNDFLLKWVDSTEFDKYSQLDNEELKCLKDNGFISKDYDGDEKKIIAKQILISAFLEGADVKSVFIFPYFLSSKGILEGFKKANEYIELDEDKHKDLYVETYLNFCERLDTDLVYEIVKDLCNANEIFYSFMKKLSTHGFTYDMVIDYFKYNCDIILGELKYEKLFNIKLNIPFLNKKDIGIRSTSFFTSSNTGYIETTFNDDELELDF